MALSVVPVAAWLRFKGTHVISRPDWGVLRRLGSTAVAHSWLNLSITIPRSLMPVLVTVVVSPAANAAFYAAWTLSGFLYLVPTHLATVLFAVASADPQVIAKKLRFTLRISAVVGLAGMAVLGLGAHLALSLFGADYAREATFALRLLVIGYLPTVPKMHYIAVCRAAGRIPRAAAVLTIAAGFEVAAAVLGGRADGLNGLSLALVAVFFLEGLVTTPSVVRAAIGHGRHRRLTARSGSVPAQPAAAAPASRDDISFPAQPDDGQRQQSGLASLLAITRTPPVPRPVHPVRHQPAPPRRTGPGEPGPPSPPAGRERSG